MSEEQQKSTRSSQLQEELLEALLKGNLEEFRQLLCHPAVNPSHKYGKPHYSTALEIACRHSGRSEFVRLLLGKVKPNVNHVVPEPIHYAASRGNDDSLELLLKDKRTKVNAEDSNGRTALHHAAKAFAESATAAAAAGAGTAAAAEAAEAMRRYERCIALLLSRRDLDANRANRRGYTAIHEAAVAGGKLAVQAILRHGRQELDLDGARGNGRTAREAILDKYPELREALPPPRADAVAARGRSPHDRLVAALRRRSIDDFRQLLLQVDTDGSMLMDPNHWFERPLNSTCLELACREDDCVEFVKVLLQAGADPNAVNPVSEKSPIHVATEASNGEILKVLLADARTDINTLDMTGKAALHYAVETSDCLCLKLLLAHPQVDVNVKDHAGVPPILAAAQNGNKDAVRIMIKLKSESLDLDSVRDEGEESTRCIIFQTYPDLKLPVAHHVRALELTVEAKMFQFLYKRQTKEFTEKLKELCPWKGVDGDDGSYTFLQYACKHGLADVVEGLLRFGANPNHTVEKNKWPPVVLACCKGYNNILTLFLTSPAGVKFDVNAKDMKGNTSLHYAAKHGDLNSVLALLSYGADIRIKNVFDKPPLPARAVENLLNQCLKSDGAHYPEEDDYRLLFDYGMLVPDKVQNIGEDFENVFSNMAFEDGNLGQINSEANETFSNLKAEMDFLFYLSQSSEHRSLLKHPIITSFLHLKWARISFIYYINLAFSISFTMLLNSFVIIQLESNMRQNKTDDAMFNFNDDLHSAPNILACMLIVFLSIMVLRELISFVLSPECYVVNKENIVDLGVIVATVLTLLVDFLPCTYRKSVTVLAILFSWVELVQTTGRLPVVSCSIEMLKTVSWTFCTFMIWYSVLIIAFGVCFFVLFHDISESKFQGLWSSLFKTFIMMTGEFNSDDDIPFEEANFIAYLIFILFVFFIAIVLLNLLTGLAVDDTQTIKNNAKILSHISRIRIIFEIERICMQWQKFMKKWNFGKPLTIKFENWINAVTLFPPSVPVKHVCVLPNKGTDIISHTEECLNCKMDIDTLGAAMNIIGSKSKISDTEDIKNRLDAIEKYHIINKEEMDQILEILNQRQVKH